MGKNHKKVKSDRINALRKQFEAFLEDDKKRKERNEYILGKLDNMRSSTAVVPHQLYKPNAFLAETRENPHDRLAIVTERNLGYNTPSRRSKEQNSDNLLVQDIVNKYILIPKRRIATDNDCATDNCVSNTATIKKDNDWQSKYDILKQLKKNELEEPIDLQLKEKHLFKYYEPQLSMSDQKVKFEGNLNTPMKKLQLDQELPEKDLSHSKSGYNYPDIPKVEESGLHLNQTQDINLEKGENEFNASTDKSEIRNKLQPDIELRNNKPIDEKQSFVVKDANNKNIDINIKTHNSNVAGKIPEYIEKTNIDNKLENHCEQEYESANVIDNFKNTQNAIRHTDDWNPIEVNTPDFSAKLASADNEEIDVKIKTYNLNAAGKIPEYMEGTNIDNKSANVIDNFDNTQNPNHLAGDWNPIVNTPDLAAKETYNEPATGDNSMLAKESKNADNVWNPTDVNTQDLSAKETYNKPPVGDKSIAKESEYPIDIINVQEFTPHDNIVLQDGVNIHPENIPTPNLNDTSVYNESQLVPDSNQVNDPAIAGLTGNEELEEEQKMFYQETANENVYQEGTGDASNVNYEQNEQYPYYEEGVQPELPPAEVNEYEETSTRYDQNYEQQYNRNENIYEEGYVQKPEGYEQYTEGYVQPQGNEQNPEGYEQHPQGYEQHPEGYEQHPEGYEQHPEGYEQHPEGYEQHPEGYEQHPEGYEQQPDGYVEHLQQEGYDQQYQQQNYEARDKIEQQLDNEQGYIDNDEVVEEKPDVQEKVEKKSSE